MWGMQVAEENCAQMNMAAGVWEKDLQQTSVGFNTIGVAPIQGDLVYDPCSSLCAGKL